jgi:hypothetical protein
MYTKIASILLAAFVALSSFSAVAKTRRGDDFVAYYSIKEQAHFPTPGGFWAMISKHVAPTLVRVPFEVCPSGLMGIACEFRNDAKRLFETKQSNERWVFIHQNMPDYIINADINGDGKDELVAAYPDGSYIISNVHTGTPRWTKFLNENRQFEVADLNANGKADLITGMSPTPGLRARMDNGSWVKLTGENTASWWAINIDGKFRDDLVLTMRNKPGLFIKRKNQPIVKINTRTPREIWRSDIDGDGKDNIVADFGVGVGTYVLLANGKWSLLSSASPTHIEVADLDGNGRDDLVFYTNMNKVVVRMDNGKWNTIWNGLTRVLAAGDIDRNGKDDILLGRLNAFNRPGFNTTSTFVLMNNSKWAELSTAEPMSVAGYIRTPVCADPVCVYIAAPGFKRYTYTFANLDGK